MITIKTPKNAKSRKLSATWTVEQDQDIEAVFSKELAKNIAEEIDKELLWEIEASFLVTEGWTKVVVRQFDLIELLEIEDWITRTCKGGTKNRDRVWLFEFAQEAAWFSLRWEA